MPSLGSDNNLNILINTQADTAGVTRTEESLSHLGGVTEKARGSMESFTKAFVFGNVIFSLTADIALKVKELFSGVGGASKEWQSQQAALNAALQSTNSAAGVSAEDAKHYAEQLEKTTPIAREVALAGENMLLTFTNIHKNVFPQTTQAVADMATAMNHGLTPNAQELSNTAIMVGKALNDPAVGLTKLMRVGVEFTTQQKDQIKALQKAGDLTGAQKIILGELAKEFGGRAAASAQTFSGKMKMLHNDINSVTSDGLIKLNSRLNELIGWWTAHEAAIKKVFVQIENFLRPSINALTKEVEKFMPTAKILWQDILKPLAEVLGVLIVVAIWGVINSINFLLHAFQDLTQWVRNVGGVFGNVWSGVRDATKSLVNDIVNFFAGLPQRAISALGNIGSKVGNEIKGALHSIHIPGFAGGVQNFSGGLAVVGEQGPELINLPSGSNVYPHGQSKQMLNQSSTNIYGDIHLNSAGAVTEFFKRLDIDGNLISKGLTATRGMN